MVITWIDGSFEISALITYRKTNIAEEFFTNFIDRNSMLYIVIEKLYMIRMLYYCYKLNDS